MIIVKITGGLTSQMHKYAVGRVLSLKHDVPLKLDITDFEKKATNVTPREYELFHLQVKAEIATKQEIDSLKGGKTYLKLRKKIKKILRINLQKKTHSDKNFLSLKDFNQIGAETYLEGEWIGESYFTGYEKSLKQDFQLRTKISERAKKQYEQINSMNSIFLHVRRGDYVSNEKTNKFHGTCSLQYYQRACEHIREHVDDPTFFIFSDDPEWVKRHLKIPGKTAIIEGNRNFEDLSLMSKCEHGITANSGFSWTASWLNTNENKIIVSPANWVQDKTLNEFLIQHFKQTNTQYL